MGRQFSYSPQEIVWVQEVVTKGEEQCTAAFGENVVGCNMIIKLPRHVANRTKDWVALLPPRHKHRVGGGLRDTLCSWLRSTRWL